MIDKVNHSNNINKKVAQLNKVFKLSLHIVCIQYLLGCCIFVRVRYQPLKKKSFLFHCLYVNFRQCVDLDPNYQLGSE